MKPHLWQRLSIRIKIIAAVAGTLVIAQLVSAMLIRQLVNEHIVSQKMSMADILTTSVLHDLKYLDNMDITEGGSAIVAKYMTYYRDITRMSIYDATGATIATSESDGATPALAADAEVQASLRLAKPSLHARRHPHGDIQIRSVAPILRGSRIIGAIDIDVSIRDVNATLAAIDLRIAWIMTVKLLMVGAVLFYLLRVAILQRLSRLTAGTRAIAAGNYEINVDDVQSDEIGVLARSFNTMAGDLQRSKQEIEGHNRELKRRVDEATAEVVNTYVDLKNAQSQLVLNEKMASLGVLIAGIAHEINTPVGAILNVTRTLERSVAKLPHRLDLVRAESAVPFEKVQECLSELVKSAVNSAASASLKELRAAEAILCEAGIEEYRATAAMLAKFNFTAPEQVRHYADCLALPSFLAFAEPLASIAQAAKISETSSQKIVEIVRALKYYAHSDKDRIERIQINESVKTALVLLRNQLKHSVEVVTDLGDTLPPVPCSSDIHQVWTNLLSNAADAIAQNKGDDGGRITLSTRLDADHLVTTVTDNGTGIPPEIMGRIFDPFFTTKDIGKGTGLGLGIVAGIVKKHGGSVTVDSAPGRTTFTVRLPLAGASERPDDEETPTTGALDAASRKPVTDPSGEEAA